MKLVANIYRVCLTQRRTNKYLLTYFSEHRDFTSLPPDHQKVDKVFKHSFDYNRVAIRFPKHVRNLALKSVSGNSFKKCPNVQNFSVQSFV